MGEISVQRISLRKSVKSTEKMQLNIVAYLFEYVYNLCVNNSSFLEYAIFEVIAKTYTLDL